MHISIAVEITEGVEHEKVHAGRSDLDPDVETDPNVALAPEATALVVSDDSSRGTL